MQNGLGGVDRALSIQQPVDRQPADQCGKRFRWLPPHNRSATRMHHAGHTPLFQLDSKTRLIGRFEQTRPQGLMHRQRSIDYAFGQIIQFFWNFLVHLGALGVLVVRFIQSEYRAPAPRVRRRAVRRGPCFRFPAIRMTGRSRRQCRRRPVRAVCHP